MSQKERKPSIHMATVHLPTRHSPVPLPPTPLPHSSRSPAPSCSPCSPLGVPLSSSLQGTQAMPRPGTHAQPLAMWCVPLQHVEST